jgi:hypothetical protein
MAKKRDRLNTVKNAAKTVLKGSAGKGASLPGAVPDFQPEDPGLTSGVTEEQQKAAAGQAKKDNASIQATAEATATAGGLSVTGSQEVKKGDANAKAAYDFAIEQGYSEEDARKLVAKAQSSKGVKFDEVLPGFKDWKKENGSEYGFKWDPKAKSFQYKKQVTGSKWEDENQDITDKRDEGIEGALDATAPLVPKFAEDTEEALDFRGNLRDQFMDTLGSANAENLTAEQLQAQEQDRQFQLGRYQDTFNDNLKNVFGRLQNRGALNSSLLGDNLRRGAIQGYGDFLTGLEASQGKQAQQYKNDMAGRTNQRISGINAAFNSGGAASIQNTYNPYLNPGSTGHMTDAQWANLAAGTRQSDIDVDKDRADRNLQIGTTPTLQDNSAGGGLGSLIGTVGGGILGSFVGAPTIGASLGGAIGGQFK